MIGASKTQMISGVITGDYTVDLNPGQLNVNSSNGSATSPVIYSTVNNGVGGFEYLWEGEVPQITIDDPTSENTSISAVGFDEEVSATITLTVTDLGAGNAETSKSLIATFVFGSGT